MQLYIFTHTDNMYIYLKARSIQRESICQGWHYSNDICVHSKMQTRRASLLLIAILAAATATVQAKTVIFFPPVTTSYVVYHSSVAAAVASLGHEVWLCLPHFMVERNLVKDKSVHILEYAQNLGNLEYQLYTRTRIVDKFFEGEAPKELEALYDVSRIVTEMANDFLSDKTFINKVKSLNADLFVLESIPFNMNMIILPYSLDIPYALIGTIHDVVLSKVTFSPATTPFPVFRLSDRMTFLQRVQSTIFSLKRINFDMFYDSSLVSKFAPHKPYKSINEIASNAEIFIAEVDHILDYPRTVLPNTKLIGGSSASPAKPLTGEFQKFVDEAKSGIIVMSFGGSVVNLPPHISDKIASAFRQLDLSVVWRVNVTSPDPKQILTSLWIPQNDLLGHQKAKLFVSHCGKNGQYEALYHGVPILCLPIYGDQGYNSERVRVKQLGLYTDMREASADQLAAMMKEIIYGGKYTENMKKASSLYRELYKVPKHEAAYWLDHVMKYGGDYMRSPGQQMPWYQLLVLDVIAFLFLIVVVILLAFYVLIKICCRLYRGSPTKVKSKRN